MTLVQQYTDKISTSSIFTYKGLIYKCIYEYAHLCIQEGPSGGRFMLLRSVLYGDSSWIWSLSSPVIASGHVCPGFGVTAAIATAVTLRRSLNTPGPPRQFSASLDCNTQKDVSVTLVCSSRCCFSEFWTLTFPVLVLLAHRPHADLFVDHIHAGETASEIEQRHGYCKTDLWCGVMTPW